MSDGSDEDSHRIVGRLWLMVGWRRRGRRGWRPPSDEARGIGRGGRGGRAGPLVDGDLHLRMGRHVLIVAVVVVVLTHAKRLFVSGAERVRVIRGEDEIFRTNSSSRGDWELLLSIGGTVQTFRNS